MVAVCGTLVGTREADWTNNTVPNVTDNELEYQEDQETNEFNKRIIIPSILSVITVTAGSIQRRWILNCYDDDATTAGWDGTE